MGADFGRANTDELLRSAQHRTLFQNLGGLPTTIAQYSEWLYMLREDTRQSLAIEGYFATEEDLEAILRGSKTTQEIANYFRTAQTIYDQALQYFRDATILPVALPVVRHIHSELFRGLDERRGNLRQSSIRILGAHVQPPEFDLPAYVSSALAIAAADIATMPILLALARAHTLFESIHPFHDGNGRVGRIVLNYLAIGQGYPPIVIKGMQDSERERYYAALEAADIGFHVGFPPPALADLRERLDLGDFTALCQLLYEGLLPQLDRLIAVALEQHEPLLDLRAVADRMGIKEGTLRLRVHRGRHIAIKRGKKLYSHPRLAL